MKNQFIQATKDILEKNLKIFEKPFCEEKVVLVYDTDSKLSTILWEAYAENLKIYNQQGDFNPLSETIVFWKIEKSDLKEKLMSLEKDCTVVLVQSTSFRLDDFRLRLNLKNQWVWCIEHNHLWYIKDEEIITYADCLEYRTPFYIELSNKLKEKFDNANKLEVVSKNWDKLICEWGFEDMKQNTWDFWKRIRWGWFPIWENFTETKDFEKVNWKLAIRAYPNMQFEVIKPEVFTIEIEKSRIVNYSKNTPEWFIELVEKIKSSEDWECFVRELGFGLNPWITWEKTLNDVNACERIMGFHMSMWKKHQIYRKKFHKKIMQRYHIDIFSDVDYILLDWEKILENEKFII